jgi:hypothetical protein
MRYTKLSFWLLLLVAIGGMTCAPHYEPAHQGPSVPEGSPNADGDAKPRLKPVPAHLKDRIDAALQNVYRRDLLVEHSFWTVFHGILGMGPDHAYLFNGKTGKRVKAIDYIARGGKIRGLEFIPTEDGLEVRTMAGSGVGQGHVDQFVAEMVEWGLPKEKKFIVNGKDYTFADFINHSKARTTVKGKGELTWSIVIIGSHFGTRARWTNNRGEKLTYEDVVRYELNEPVIESPACGGTHRLFGLTWAYHLHLKEGGKTTGVWKEVAAKTAHFKKLARQLQNKDGSFSTEYFRGPGNSRNLTLRIATTGHILEWLSLAMTDAELRQKWVQNAAGILAAMILENSDKGLDGGGMYHAAHGLLMYRTRVFGRLGDHIPVVPLPPSR